MKTMKAKRKAARKAKPKTMEELGREARAQLMQRYFISSLYINGDDRPIEDFSPDERIAALWVTAKLLKDEEERRRAAEDELCRAVEIHLDLMQGMCLRNHQLWKRAREAEKAAK
jgi:hypothetical protein